MVWRGPLTPIACFHFLGFSRLFSHFFNFLCSGLVQGLVWMLFRANCVGMTSPFGFVLAMFKIFKIFRIFAPFLSSFVRYSSPRASHRSHYVSKRRFCAGDEFSSRRPYGFLARARLLF